MKTVSMLELRQNAQPVVETVERGQAVLLTYRGRPVATLQPIEKAPNEGDPFYSLGEIATAGENVSNQEIDEQLYGT